MFFFLKRNSHPEGHRLMPFGRVWAGHLGVITRAETKHTYGLDRNMHQLSASIMVGQPFIKAGETFLSVPKEFLSP